MVALVDIPFNIDVNQSIKRLGIRPGTEHVRNFRSLASKVREIGRPKVLYKVSYIDRRSADSVTIDGVRFTSLALRKNLDAVQRVFPYIATCGTELDTIEIAQGDLLKKSWIAFLKQNLFLAGMEYLQGHINKRYKIPKLASMNPGAGDASVWPIEQMEQLFTLFDEDEVERLIGVRTTKNHIIVPDMSIAGILFPTKIDFYSCQLCHREKCPDRRAPFEKELWESINREENQY